MTSKKLRMYIVLRSDLSPTAAFLAYGHATLGTYLTWRDDPLMQEWERTSFVKIALQVPDHTHLNRCKEWGEHRTFSESTMNNTETCLGFRVMRDYDQRLLELPTWVQQPPTPG